MKEQFTVVYRSGGTDNFKWNKTLLLGTRDDMLIEQAKIVMGGRLAYVYSERDLRIGLPETYGREVTHLDVMSAKTFLESKGVDIH